MSVNIKTATSHMAVLRTVVIDLMVDATIPGSLGNIGPVRIRVTSPRVILVLSVDLVKADRLMKDEDPALVIGAQVDHALIRIPGLVTNVMAWDITLWIVLLAIGTKKTVVSTMIEIKWKSTVRPKMQIQIKPTQT